MSKLETPELDKMSKVTDLSQPIGEFLDWLRSEKHIVLARWRNDLTDWVPCYGGDDHGAWTYAEATNCDGGKVVEGRVMRVTLDGERLGKTKARFYDEGETCPFCKGEGGKVITLSERLVEESYSIQEILAEFFEIDLDKVEAERRAILDALRMSHDDHASQRDGRVAVGDHGSQRDG